MGTDCQVCSLKFPSGILQLIWLDFACTKCLQNPKGEGTSQVTLGISSLNWENILQQMATPSQETYQVRALHLALDLHGLICLAEQIQGEVHLAVTEAEAIAQGKGMEETLVAESSLGSSSEEETGDDGPEDEEVICPATDDFFTGLQSILYILNQHIVKD